MNVNEWEKMLKRDTRKPVMSDVDGAVDHVAGKWLGCHRIFTNPFPAGLRLISSSGFACQLVDLSTCQPGEVE